MSVSIRSDNGRQIDAARLWEDMRKFLAENAERVALDEMLDCLRFGRLFADWKYN